MKQAIKILLIIFLMSACNTTKKIVETSQTKDQSIKISQVEQSQSEVKKNNDLSTQQETVSETIEYYPPEVTPGTESPGEVKTNENPEPKKGAIKSITRTTTRAKTEDKGTTVVNDNKTSKTDSSSNEKIQSSTKETKEPAPDPKRFRYIFGILLLLTIAGFIIYKKWNSIKSKIKPIFQSFFG